MMRGYYLTSLKYARSNIEHHRAKISRISDLNDPFELANIYHPNPAILDGFARSKDKIDEDNGVMCFSKAWWNPLLWAHYGDKHRGVALGFDISEDVIAEIEYIKSLIVFEPDKFTPPNNLIFVSRWLFSKYEGWEYEDEIRASFSLDHTDVEDGMHFIKFSKQLALREVILGARCEHSLTDMQNFLMRHGFDVNPIQAQLAADRFAVIAPFNGPASSPAAE